MPITFSCGGCGQAYKVPDTSAGRSTKCRKCGAVVNIPKSSSIASKPAAPPPAADDFSSFSVDAPPNTGLKKKKKGKKGLMVALLGLAFAFFGCCLLPGMGGGAYYYFYMMGGDDSMKFMPSNPKAIVSIRASDILQSDLYAKVKKELPDSDKGVAEMNTAATEMTGMTSDDIDRILFGYSTKEDASIVVVTKNPVDIQKVLKAGKQKDKVYKETKIGKYTVHEEEAKEGRFGTPTSFCVTGPKMLVVAPTKSLKAILERNKEPDLSEPMKAARKHADMKKTIAVAADVKAIKAEFPNEATQMKMGFEKVEAAALMVNIKSDVVVESALVCPDDASAENLRKSIEGLVTLAKGFPGVPAEAVTAIDAVKFTNSGNAVLANAVISGTDVAKGFGKTIGTKSVPVFQQGPPIPVGPPGAMPPVRP